jgi:hypothetical protein
MLFKAKIAIPLLIGREEKATYIKTFEYDFIFSKNVIRFPPSVQEKFGDRFFIDLKNDDAIFHKMRYGLIKLEIDDSARSRKSNFQAQFEEKSKMNLVLTPWNKIKMNIIHERYWVQSHWDDLLKILISATIGFIFAICGQSIGYRQGFENGVKAAGLHHQDTIPHSR